MPDEIQPHKDEKTEPPTEKKLQKQREDGNIFFSNEMAIVLVTFFGALILRFIFPWVFNRLTLLTTSCFSHMSTVRLDENNIVNYITQFLLNVLEFLGPLMLLLTLVGGLSTLIQTGWVVSWKKANWKFEDVFKIDWQALNPLNPKKVMELFLNIAKIVVLTWVLYTSFKDSVQDWIPFMGGPVISLMVFLGNLLFNIVMKLCIFMFLLACWDFVYRYRKHQDDLKMTKHEVKEEMKQADGDPIVKRALRQKRFALFRRIMMEAVPKADVVITNPTHFSVAIQYDSKIMEAPKVVAKGIGPMAQRIKEIARQHHVPVVENKPLAQILFKTVDVGAFIPVNLYKAVAEVLAYVYKLKKAA
ncbi:MAG: EscU/YscU/HrcU family type III secretion system export apparatus switch protein [Candidatus Aureabacteria bacterium]|nr:EscU/YscU/HrcU family type III secretion system export apparatus switch protein [Candidatus Auribacterota bacterium]